MRVFSCLVIAVAALAAEPPSAAEKARAAYEEGIGAFKGEDYETALAHFERAYLLDNAPVLLFNMARACEEMGRAKKAVYYYELYLDRVPDAPDRPEVERRIRVMRLLLEKQEPAPEPAPPPPAKEEPAPQEEASPAQAQAEVSPEPPTSLRPYAYATLAAGAVGLGVGAVLGVRASELEATHHDTDDPEEAAKARDEGESAVVGANTSYVLGAALLAAGGVLWFLEPSASEGVAFSMTPAGVAWSARW